MIEEGEDDAANIIVAPNITTTTTIINNIIHSFNSLNSDNNENEIEEELDKKRKDILVRLALDDPRIFTFGELLEDAEIQSFLIRHKTLHNLFVIFAYGTYQDYMRATNGNTTFSEVDKLTGVQERKLKQLSIVTLATQSCTVKYEDMSAAICASNMREMEDFVIDEVIFPGLVSGRLDQQNRVFCIDWVFVQRDVRREDMRELVITPLRKWANECKNVLEQVHNQAEITSRAIAETHKETEYFIQSLHKVKTLNDHKQINNQ